MNAELPLNGASYKGLLTPFLCLLLALVPLRAKAPPISEEQPRELPGTPAGKTETYWLAPFVKVSTDTVGRTHSSIVTWYAQGDRVKTQEVIGVQPSFVTARENGQIFWLGVNEDWKMAQPKELDANDVMATGSLASSEDSHVLVEEISPDRKQVYENIYVGGVLAGRWGPFLSSLGRNVQVGSDGSTALIAWKDSSMKGT